MSEIVEDMSRWQAEDPEKQEVQKDKETVVQAAAMVSSTSVDRTGTGYGSGGLHRQMKNRHVGT